MTPLTSAQVLALSPDDASSKAAKGLMKPAKWVTLGAFEGGLWGECQGSGAKPYQVMVDANGLATKCSCPSRKFPCKHGLALMLMFADSVGTFGSKAPPWMEEWLAGRQQRAEKQTAKKEQEAATPPDPEKVAKKQEARIQKMQAGAQYMGLWMRDLLREGIADLPGRPNSFWSETAARMVDAQVPGLARRIEEMQSLLYTGPEWPQKLLAAMGRAQLLLDAFQNYADLPADLQSDVRVAMGWAQDKNSALTTEKVDDLWKVVGVVYESNGPLHERRAWLTGKNSGSTALLLDFSHGGRKFETACILGTEFPAVLTYFPSAAPQRAMVLETKGPTTAASGLEGADSFAECMGAITSRWAGNPFSQRQPMALRQTRLNFENHRWSVVDASGALVPTRLSEKQGWQLAALSGGAPVDVFGEWQENFCPIAAVVQGEWISLTDA